VIGLAAGYSLSYAVGTVVFAVKLRRRLVPTRRSFVIRTHVRLIVAALIAAVPTELLALLMRRGLGTGAGGSLAAVAVAAPAGTACFVLLARRMRVQELDHLAGLVPIGRFRR
jgi:putative peptidoglycan lipid II flippase